MGRKLKAGERILISGHEHVVEHVSNMGARVHATGKLSAKLAEVLQEKEIEIEKRYGSAIISARPDLEVSDYLDEIEGKVAETPRKKAGRPKGSKNKPREFKKKRRKTSRS